MKKVTLKKLEEYIKMRKWTYIASNKNCENSKSLYSAAVYKDGSYEIRFNGEAAKLRDLSMNEKEYTTYIDEYDIIEEYINGYGKARNVAKKLLEDIEYLQQS